MESLMALDILEEVSSIDPQDIARKRPIIGKDLLRILDDINRGIAETDDAINKLASLYGLLVADYGLMLKEIETSDAKATVQEVKRFVNNYPALFYQANRDGSFTADFTRYNLGKLYIGKGLYTLKDGLPERKLGAILKRLGDFDAIIVTHGTKDPEVAVKLVCAEFNDPNAKILLNVCNPGNYTLKNDTGNVTYTYGDVFGESSLAYNDDAKIIATQYASYIRGLIQVVTMSANQLLSTVPEKLPMHSIIVHEVVLPGINGADTDKARMLTKKWQATNMGSPISLAVNNAMNAAFYLIKFLQTTCAVYMKLGGISGKYRWVDGGVGKHGTKISMTRRIDSIYEDKSSYPTISDAVSAGLYSNAFIRGTIHDNINVLDDTGSMVKRISMEEALELYKQL